MYHEEMLKQSPRQQLFNDYARQLMRRYPQLKHEIVSRLNHVNEHWTEVINGLILPPGINSCHDTATMLAGNLSCSFSTGFLQVRNDEICPLCQDAEETTLHLLWKCCSLINQRLEILGSHYLPLPGPCFTAFETYLEACKGL